MQVTDLKYVKQVIDVSFRILWRLTKAAYPILFNFSHYIITDYT